MTAIAPVAPDGASTAPATPVAPAAPAAPDFEGLDAMERTIAQTMHESRELLAEDKPITDRPRDPKTGQFVPRAHAEAGWNVVPDVPSPESETTETPADIVAPEGHVIPKALDASKVQGFRVLDAEGEIVPPDLTFEVNFRGPNGENQPRLLDVPKLVNYARMGVYNHEREQQAVAVQQHNTQLTSQVAQYDQALRQMQQERALLLSDPDYLLKQLALYEQQNTPEARAQQEREQLEQQRQALAYQAAGQENERYMEQKLEPALDFIAKTYPNVTLQDLAEQLVRLAEPYTVQTPFGPIINPQAHPHIAQLVVQQLAPWAEQRHMAMEERFSAARAPTAPPAAAPPAATPPSPAPPTPSNAELQARAQRARRMATATTKPPGGNGATPQGASPPTPPTSNRDLQDFIVGRALAQTRGG